MTKEIFSKTTLFRTQNIMLSNIKTKQNKNIKKKEDFPPENYNIQGETDQVYCY